MRRVLILSAGLGALYALAQAAREGTLGADAQDVAEGAVASVAGWELPARAEQYRDLIAATESAYDIPANMLARLLYEESRYRDDIITGAVRSRTGALGIAQFEPATAAELGIDPLNARAAIVGAGKYLRRLYDRTGDWRDALAAYNWGIGNVLRKGRDAAPAETRTYVADITGDIGYG